MASAYSPHINMASAYSPHINMASAYSPYINMASAYSPYITMTSIHKELYLSRYEGTCEDKSRMSDLCGGWEGAIKSLIANQIA